MKELTLLNFSDVYPDKGSFVEALRRFRAEHGLNCSRCGCTHLCWDKAHKSWICSRCGHETTFRSGTAMPLYSLDGDVEMDEGFFSTETPEDQKDCPLKRGHGSQRKIAVLVMDESSFPEIPSGKKRSTPKIVKHIKMEIIVDLKASTEKQKTKQAMGGKVNATTDGSNTYVSLEKNGAVASHKAIPSSWMSGKGLAVGAYCHQKRQKEHP